MLLQNSYLRQVKEMNKKEEEKKDETNEVRKQNTKKRGMPRQNPEKHSGTFTMEYSHPTPACFT